jgi:S-formylglutathione hydrolase FrmB
VRAMSVWRRALLAAILPAVLGAIVVALLLGGDERHGASVETIAIESDAVGRTLPVSVVVPEGAGDEPRPLLVFLHGRDGDEQSGLTEEMYSALAEQGRLAPVVAFPNGGEASYWHDRADGAWGRWAAREVVDEVAARFRIDRERIAIGGISMGGFGTLNLARIYPDRFCAVGGHSAALWRTGGETAAGSFDDEADFERNDVLGAAAANPAVYGQRPVWLDVGREDPFRPAVQELAATLEAGGADLEARTWEGGHESSYWADHWDEYLRFYGAALERCPTGGV